MSKKYPQGYLPKIKYWMSRRAQATNEHDKAQANAKLAYFVTRHTDKYGPLDLTNHVDYDALHTRPNGGSFEVALREAFWKADSNNRTRLIEAFPETFLP